MAWWPRAAAPATRPRCHWQGDFGPLRVRGRADGYDPAARRLEEIKTFRGDLAHVPDNHRQLHWAQVRIYGALMCRQLGLAAGGAGAGVLRHRHADRKRSSPSASAADDCRLFLKAQCQRFAAWAGAGGRPPHARATRRCDALHFPLPSFRAGQRELAEAVYRARRAGRCLMAQAPTGIGKTVGTLFPLLKACARAAASSWTRCSTWLPRPPAASSRWTRCDRFAPARRTARAGLPQHRCACWSWSPATRPASTPTRPATASPARWRAASTTACRAGAAVAASWPARR